MIDLKELQEKVILIAVSTGEEDHTEASLDELEELAATAGAVTIARVTQNRERVHPVTSCPIRWTRRFPSSSSSVRPTRCMARSVDLKDWQNVTARPEDEIVIVSVGLYTQAHIGLRSPFP